MSILTYRVYIGDEDDPYRYITDEHSFRYFNSQNELRQYLVDNPGYFCEDLAYIAVMIEGDNHEFNLSIKFKTLNEFMIYYLY